MSARLTKRRDRTSAVEERVEDVGHGPVELEGAAVEVGPSGPIRLLDRDAVVVDLLRSLKRVDVVEHVSATGFQ
jgi:hypothetical protein